MRHFIFLLAFIPVLLFGQKEDYIWQTDYICGSGLVSQIDFGHSPPHVSAVEREPCTSLTSAFICDSSGILLLYTNGLAVYNKYDEIVENGDSINFGIISTSAGIYGYNIPQGAFFLRRPGSHSDYYLFHMFIDWELNRLPMSARYSVIDMAGNGGHGLVTAKDMPLMAANDSMDFIQATAVRHANGRDWWVIVPSHLGPDYYRFLLTPDGIDGPWEQEIGFRKTIALGDLSVWGSNGFGQRVFSLDGTRFADYDHENFTQVFDFDRCTGLLSNARLIEHYIDPVFNNAGGSVAFSPSGRFLYISNLTSDPGGMACTNTTRKQPISLPRRLCYWIVQLSTSSIPAVSATCY